MNEIINELLTMLSTIIGAIITIFCTYMLDKRREKKEKAKIISEKKFLFLLKYLETLIKSKNHYNSGSTVEAIKGEIEKFISDNYVDCVIFEYGEGLLNEISKDESNFIIIIDCEIKKCRKEILNEKNIKK